jgi:hypothetical protein
MDQEESPKPKPLSALQGAVNPEVLAKLERQTKAGEEAAARVIAQANEQIQRGTEPLRQLQKAQEAALQERKRQEASDRRWSRAGVIAGVIAVLIALAALVVAIVALHHH